MTNLPKKELNLLLIFITIILLLILAKLFHPPLYALYNEENHLSFHIITEFFSIFISFSIFLYGWKAYPFIKTTPFLYLPIVFFAVGSFDILHALTYNGMPHFFTNTTTGGKFLWFWFAARITEASFVLCILFMKKQIKSLLVRWLLLVCAVFYVLIITATIFYFDKQLPVLMIEGVGTTTLKNTIEYFICLLHLLAALTAYKQYQQTKDESYLDMVLAFTLLLIGELIFTTYISLYDFDNMLGHLFKALGYAAIFKSFYFHMVQLTFYKKDKAEKELKNTQELLESFVTHTPDSFLILDREGTIVHANEGVEKTFGWNSHEILGENIRILSPKTEQSQHELLPRVLSGENIYGYETSRIRKDNKIIYVSLTLSPIRDVCGEITNIAAIARDISDRKLSEEVLRKSKQELKQTLRNHTGIIFKFRKIDGEFIHTLCDGDLIYRFNLTPQYIEGKNLKGFYGEEKAIELEKYYVEAWNGKEITYETDGPNCVIAVTLKPIKKDGEVVEVIGSCIDITSLKKTEELLRKSEKLAVVGELAAGVAHEIRNPLTTLKGFIQLLESQISKENKSFVDLMLSEVDRIEMITNEFMVVAKPQAVTFKENDLKQIIEHVVTFLQPQALLCNIEIDMIFETNESSVMCDVNQLKQVFINLIKNAFEAMPDGGKLSIQLTDVNNTHFLVRIKDTGCGIPKELIPKLGEPFYTLKEKGTGLGLMVSYRIIETHKGNISFQSEVNQGTTVEIELPIYQHMNEQALMA